MPAMKPLLPAMIAGVLLQGTVLLARPVERTFTLPDSIATGVNNSQEVLALKEQVLIAQQTINEAKSQIYPKIDFNINASKLDNNIPTVLPPSFNAIYLPARVADLYYDTRISLWQYLYAGGRYTTNVRLAEINLSQAQSQTEAARNKVILEVRKAFYACLVNQERIKAYETAITETEGSTRAAGAARLHMQLARERHELEKNRLKFLNAVGLELTTDFDLRGDLSFPDEEYDLNKCLAWACQYRSELRQTQFQETMNSLRVNLSLTERYPTVTLGANYELAGERMEEKNWNATINLNVPVFDGWASWARIKQRRNQAREGKIRRSQIEDRIRYEVREALMDYDFWKEQAAAFTAVPQKQSTADERLELSLLRLDTLQHVLESHAQLEWAIGKPLK
jgi:outer membrane protein TolC